jgi:hypothetical protein
MEDDSEPECNTIEIKYNLKSKLTSTDIKKMVAKGCVIGLVSAGEITKPGKALCDENGITYAENVRIKEREKEGEKE